LGFRRCTAADLDGGDTPQRAAAVFDEVLNNTASRARRDCVIVNAAFAIRVICPAKSMDDCIAEARESLESGRALAVFNKFIDLNR
jgi:anthranilate phosphoribosyltransferase